MRQGGAGRSGVRRPANHPHLGAHCRGYRGGDTRRRHAAVNAIGGSVLARRKALGAERAALSLSRGTEFTVRVYKGEIESLVSAESRGIGLRTFREHRVGFSYTSDFEPAALDSLVEEALLNGRYNHADEANVLPEPRPFDPLAGLASSALAGVDPQPKIDFALKMERRPPST